MDSCKLAMFDKLLCITDDISPVKAPVVTSVLSGSSSNASSSPERILPKEKKMYEPVLKTAWEKNLGVGNLLLTKWIKKNDQQLLHLLLLNIYIKILYYLSKIRGKISSVQGHSVK